MSEIFKDFVGGLLLTITAIAFARISLNKKIEKPWWVIVLTILIVSSTFPLLYRLMGGTLASIQHLIIISILFTLLFKITFPKGIFLSFLHSIVILIADIFTIVFCIYIFKMPNNYFYDVFAGSIWSNFAVSLIFVIITLLIKKQLQKIMNYKISSNKLIAIFSILAIICVAVFFYIGFSDIKLDNTLLISVFGMIIFIVILLSLVKQKIDNNKITEKYDSLIEFMKSYEEVIDQQRIFHHENKNQLINIKAKLTDKEKNKKIIEYIDSILNEKIKFNKEKYSKLKYLPSNGFKGIFYYKISKAEDLGIKVSINISNSIEKSLLHNMENNNYKQLCRVIGVYLDNAIESSLITDNKVLGIEMYTDENNVDIIISNSYCGKIDINQINKQGYSTKGKGRGYGLSLVSNILNNNNNFKSETQITNDLYIQKLTIVK